MELESAISDLQSTLRKHRSKLVTEEAAKTTLVLPFLRALGYDIFNPDEVVPEFVCDVGTKKGEKVDYAICVNGEMQMLVECKPATGDLSIKHASQLYRYFAATDARIALLTNGVVYRFFTDAEKPNMMDDRPFFTFDLDDYKKSDLRSLAAFERTDFNLDRIVSHAGALKLQSEVSAELRKEFAEPSDDLVKLIAALIRDGVNERLETAIKQGASPEEGIPEIEAASDIETTQVEIDGFNIIRAICAGKVEPSRVFMRDAKSYCAVLLDDNNRRTIARLHFNSDTSRHLGLFAGKDERRESIGDPVDIYRYREEILGRIDELEKS